MEDNVSIAGFCAYAEQIVSLEIAGLFFIWKYGKKELSEEHERIEGVALKELKLKQFQN